MPKIITYACLLVTYLVELTNVSTWVQGSPHFGQDRVFLFLPLPPPPDVGVVGGVVGLTGGSPAPIVLSSTTLVEIALLLGGFFRYIVESRPKIQFSCMFFITSKMKHNETCFS